MTLGGRRPRYMEKDQGTEIRREKGGDASSGFRLFSDTVMIDFFRTVDRQGVKQAGWENKIYKSAMITDRYMI